MTKTITNKIGRVAIASILSLVIALFAFSVPAYAAEENPDQNGSTEASVSFTPGELKLLSTPSLDFGEHPVSAKEESYEAKTVSADVRVSDLRGSGSGWNLMVALSEFSRTTEDGAQPTLEGATITTSGATVSAVDGNVGTPPTQENPVLLTSDGTETPVLTAAKDAGMGVWDMSWQAANTKLTVKAGTAQQGTSVATLTWSLQSTP